MSHLNPSPRLLTGPVGIGTTTPTEALEIGSSQAQQNRLKISSYSETDGTGAAELIRFFLNTPANLNGNSAKGAIAWFDASVSTTQSKVWAQAHDYLNYYNPVTFAPSAVNTSTGVITLPAQNDAYVNQYQVQFSSTGTLPSGISAGTNYYLKLLTSTTFQVYNDYALTSQVTLTDQGTGTHTITPNNDFCSTDGAIFNRHRHFSIEVSKNDGVTKTSRFSIPYDYDTTEISTFSANFNVNAGLSRIVGSSTSDKQLQFGNGPRPNPREPDGTNIRWIIKQDNTTETGSSVGSNFRIVPCNDSGAAANTALYIARNSGFVGLGGNISPGVLLDLGVFSAGGVTTQARINRGSNAAQQAQLIFSTGGANKWSLGMRNDSTDNYQIRDSVNFRNHLVAYLTQGITQLALGVATTVAVKTSNYSILATDHTILANGAITVTLPDATVLAGEQFIVKDITAASNVTLNTTSSQTIDGATSTTLTPGMSVTVVSDGSNWWIV
jgi:hypothetical protein